MQHTKVSEVQCLFSFRYLVIERFHPPWTEKVPTELQTTLCFYSTPYRLKTGILLGTHALHQGHMAGH